MGSLKTIRLVYIIYSIYTIFVMFVSNYPIISAFFGLVSLWSMYFAFAIGYKSVRVNVNFDCNDLVEEDKFFFSNIVDWKNWQYFISSVFCWISSILAARFYTSRSFSSVIRGLFTGVNGYLIYQRHVVEASIGVLSIRKIPFILMLMFITVMLFWSVLGIMLSGRKITIIQIIYLISIVLSYYYFGLARGTNFELYTVFVLVMYGLLNRGSNSQRDRKKRRKAIIIISLSAFMVVLIFRYMVALRGNVFNYQICSELKYNPDSMLSRTFPILTNIGLSIFRYFGYGIYTIGTIINEVTLNSFKGIVAHLIPFGYELLFNDTLPNIVRDTVDVGVGWVADYFSIVNCLGFPLMLMLLFVLGRMNARLLLSNRAKLLKDLVGALLFIQMLSIPVGNFIAISTPNKLTTIFVLLWYSKKYFYTYKPQYIESDNSQIEFENTQSEKVDDDS